MAEITLTSDNFENEVLHSDIPVLVDFWATWCGPCQMMAPVVAEIGEEMAGKVKVGKINVDEQPYLANKFQIDAIPTLMVFKNGKATETFVGMRPKSVLTAALQ